ncbi:hypothetical protein, partial [Alkalibacterium sp. s-m-22]
SVIKLFNPDKDWIILPSSTEIIIRATRNLGNIIFHRLLGVTYIINQLLVYHTYLVFKVFCYKWVTNAKLMLQKNDWPAGVIQEKDLQTSSS